VITETQLPVFDGYALCAVLRRDSVTRSVPILVVTSDTRPLDLDRARDAGADAVCTKPVTPAALLKEIQRLIRIPAEDRPALIRAEKPGQLPSFGRRRTLTKAYLRFETSKPPSSPPVLFCPACDGPLTYERSHLGGVNSRQAEQWDDYSCPSCGRFEYRQRTRRLRQVV
jgi:hypothetical protein